MEQLGEVNELRFEFVATEVDGEQHTVSCRVLVTAQLRGALKKRGWSAPTCRVAPD